MHVSKPSLGYLNAVFASDIDLDPRKEVIRLAQEYPTCSPNTVCLAVDFPETRVVSG